MLRHRENLARVAEFDDKKTRARVLKACQVNSWMVRGIKDIFQSFREVAESIDNFDKEAHLLNCNNGMLDLKTSTLVPHSKEQLFTYCLTVDYDPEAVSDDWDGFLNSLGMSEDVDHFLQVMAGYCMTGETREEVLFYIFGPARSGKGTFTESISSVLGSLVAGLNFKTFTADRVGDTQNFDLAPLKNKRLVIASESRRYERLNEAVLKSVTGGDEIYCAFKGKTHFSYRPAYKIILTSNHPASADPLDTAAWSRLRVIQFSNSFLGNEDKSLKAKLKTDESQQAILAWMAEGARMWYEEGLAAPEEISSFTNSQREESNTALLFLRDCTSKQLGSVKSGAELFHAYVVYCNHEGHTPYKRRSFTQALLEAGVTLKVVKIDGKAVRCYEDLEFVGTGNGDWEPFVPVEV